MFQGQHQTDGGYLDTLDFNIVKKDEGSVVRAFSISNIHGALGDAGQNYYTLSYMFDKMGYKDAGLKVVYGCGKQQ